MPISEANLINLYQNLRQYRFAQLIFDVKIDQNRESIPQRYKLVYLHQIFLG